MKNVIVVIGAGLIGQAITRRVGPGKHVVLADVPQENAESAAQVLTDAGFETSTAVVDVSSRESVHALAGTAADIGQVTGVIHAAEHAVSSAAIAAITELADELGIGEDAREQLRRDYRSHFETIEAQLLDTGTGVEDPERPPAAPGEDDGAALMTDPIRDGSQAAELDEHTRLRLAVLARKREVLLRLRRDGTVDDAVARRIQTRLDIEELRLTGPDFLE